MYRVPDLLPMRYPRPAGAARWLLALLGVAVAMLLVPVSAASAHDSLTGTSPENGQKLAEVPAEVEMQFSNNPLGLGAKVIVEDQDGQDWAEGDVKIIDNTARQQISADAPAGTYTVLWRVVSSDSHPIEGSFEFTAAAGGPGGQGPSGTALTSAAPGASTSTDPASADSAAGNQAESGGFWSSSGAWLAAGVVVLVILALVIRTLLVRRRRDTPPPA